MEHVCSANNIKDCPVCGTSDTWELCLVVHPAYGCRHFAMDAPNGTGAPHRYAWIGTYEPYKIVVYTKERRVASRGWNSTGQIIYRVPY